jgi:hypothetical protein
MVTFNYTEEFRRQAKRLAKRYRSLADDINRLQHANAVLSTKTSSTSKSSYTHNLPTFPAHVVKTVKQSHTIDTHPLK